MVGEDIEISRSLEWIGCLYLPVILFGTMCLCVNAVLWSYAFNAAFGVWHIALVMISAANIGSLFVPYAAHKRLKEQRFTEQGVLLIVFVLIALWAANVLLAFPILFGFVPNFSWL